MAKIQAHRFHRVYPRALFVLAGWYPPRWWEGDEAEQEDLMTRYDCSVADRESVIEYIIAPRKAANIYRCVCNGRQWNCEQLVYRE